MHFGVPLVDAAPAGALSEVTDLFSAGNFLDLTDDQKLSRPSFEPMPAGARIRPPGEAAPFAESRQAELRYETFVCDDDGAARACTAPRLLDVLFASAASVGAARRARRGEASCGRARATTASPIRSCSPMPARCACVSKATVTAAAGSAGRDLHARGRAARSPTTCSSRDWGWR